MGIDLSSVKVRFQREIDYFEDYLEFNEGVLKDRNACLKKNEEEDQYNNPSIPMASVYKEEFEKIPSLFFSSSILMLFSILESTLNEICREIIDQCKIPIGIQDYTGKNYVGKTKKFLESFGKINFSEIEAPWGEISNFQRLRNNIIHENSTIAINDSNRDKFLNQLCTLGINVFDANIERFYILDNKPVNRLKINIKKYVDEILRQVEQIDYIKFERPGPQIEPSPF